MFTSNSSDNNQNLIFPTRIHRSAIRPSHIIREIFSLSAIPNMTQVWHFWAGVSNFVTGGNHQPNHFVSSNSMGASKMGHSSLTHAIAYSSRQVGSEEAHFNAYHFAIGDTSYQFSNPQQSFPWQTCVMQFDFGIQHPQVQIMVMATIYRCSRKSWLSLDTVQVQQATALSCSTSTG
jgi:hypothetical protein